MQWPANRGPGMPAARLIAISLGTNDSGRVVSKGNPLDHPRQTRKKSGQPCYPLQVLFRRIGHTFAELLRSKRDLERSDEM